MDYTDPTNAAWALQDPATPGEALATIAAHHQDLRDRVVTHPNAYPQLVAWIAAQSATSSPSAQTPTPGWAPAEQYAPAQQYASPQPGGQYGASPQPYHGYPAGPPKKKKTGLIIGLAGGGVAVVIAIVAVLGIFVFDWFGRGGSAPTLTKSQAERFVDSDFMQGLTGGDRLDDYLYDPYDPDTLGYHCDAADKIYLGGDSWETIPTSVSVFRFSSTLSPDQLFDTLEACFYEDIEKGIADPDVTDFDTYRDKISVTHQGNGSWTIERSSGVATFFYGNIVLSFQPDSVQEDDLRDLFGQFTAAVDAAR
ncbi:MAG: hypothetical protein FWD11_10430 [Micrococcales bacterium]|nr:hypothetical protein [Micrococcales bacterium]